MTARLLPPLVTPLSLVDVVGAPETDEPPVVRVFAPSVLPHPLLGTGGLFEARLPPVEVVPPPPVEVVPLPPVEVVPPPLFPAVPERPPVPEPPVLVEPPPPAPAVPEPPVLVELLVVVVEPPVPVLPPLPAAVLEPPLPPLPDELPPLALLLDGAELPPVGALLALLDFPEEPPWLALVLAVELPPVDPVPPPESLEHDATSAGRPTHRVAKSIFRMDEPPNRELRPGDTRTSSTRDSEDANIDGMSCLETPAFVRKAPAWVFQRRFSEESVGSVVRQRHSHPSMLDSRSPPRLPQPLCRGGIVGASSLRQARIVFSGHARKNAPAGRHAAFAPSGFRAAQWPRLVVQPRRR